MCKASGTSYQRIHVFSVPILTHQETVNGNSDRYDQYFQQLQELGPGSDQHVNILSIVRGKRVNIQHPIVRGMQINFSGNPYPTGAGELADGDASTDRRFVYTVENAECGMAGVRAARAPRLKKAVHGITHTAQRCLFNRQYPPRPAPCLCTALSVARRMPPPAPPHPAVAERECDIIRRAPGCPLALSRPPCTRRARPLPTSLSCLHATKSS